MNDTITTEALFKGLSKHASPIALAFNHNGQYAESDGINTLSNLRCIRLNRHGEYVLATPLKKLISHATQFSSGSHSNSILPGLFSELEHQCNQRKLSKFKGHEEDAENFLAHIERVVEEILYALDSQTEMLRLTLENEFGYIKSLDAKQREADFVIKSTATLIEQLDFNFDVFEAIEDDVDVAHLIHGDLYDKSMSTLKELKALSLKISKLLLRFRKSETRTKVALRVFDTLKKHPDYTAEASKLDEGSMLLNMISYAGEPATRQLQVGSSSTYSFKFEQALELFLSKSNLKREAKTKSKAGQSNLTRNVIIEPYEPPVLKDVERLYIDCFNLKCNITAKAFYESESLDYDYQYWLRSVSFYFDQLSDTARSLYQRHFIAQPYHDRTHSALISDIQIELI
jgi:hypothetical protein